MTQARENSIARGKTCLSQGYHFYPMREFAPKTIGLSLRSLEPTHLRNLLVDSIPPPKWYKYRETVSFLCYVPDATQQLVIGWRPGQMKLSRSELGYLESLIYNSSNPKKKYEDLLIKVYYYDIIVISGVKYTSVKYFNFENLKVEYTSVKYSNFDFTCVRPFIIDRGRVFCVSIINPSGGFKCQDEMMMYIVKMKEKKERRIAKETTFLCLKNKTSIYNIYRVVSYL
jgi:hypothetical protein